MTQEYSLNKKDQLVVSPRIQFSGDQGSGTFKQVYDRKGDA